MRELTVEQINDVSGGGVVALYFAAKGAWAAGKAVVGYAARNKITTAAAVGVGVGYSQQSDPECSEE